MHSELRLVAMGLAETLDAPLKIVMPILRECQESELTRYVSLMFEAQRTGRWDAFAIAFDIAADGEEQKLDPTELAPGADVSGFLAAPCPLLTGSHLLPEDQTWAVWMMHTGYKLMEAGENFQACVGLETGWDAALASALDEYGIGRGRALSLVLAQLEAAEGKRGKPAGIRWYLNRKIDEDDDGSHAAALVAYANIGLMLDEGDRYDAHYRMQDLRSICRRSYDDKASFAELNAWVWNRGRKDPYPVPKHGRDTKALLDDLKIWGKHVCSQHEELVDAFVTGFLSGLIDASVVRRMRKASIDIHRSLLVENKHTETRYRRQHLYVCRIHGLLDNIEHMSPNDAASSI
ncbi:hypothetical protein G6L37_34565 [Agrobacterium rubi]|nr:hypothetical protein [Agrobacterium rubi]NTF23691.1 hypothetical protein [Agrobacterium rubi]